MVAGAVAGAEGSEEGLGQDGVHDVQVGVVVVGGGEGVGAEGADDLSEALLYVGRTCR